MFPSGNYMFKVNNGNTRTRCELCSKLTIKIPERRRMVTFTEEILTGKCFLSQAQLKIFQEPLFKNQEPFYITMMIAATS